MPRKYFISLFLIFTIVSFSKDTLDCKLITGGITECNPYVPKLLHAKEVKYDDNKKKLIVSKTLPVPEKKKIKVISVADMIEKYVKVEDSVRFKGTEEMLLNELINELTQNNDHKKLHHKKDNTAFPKNTHTLESIRAKKINKAKTHTLHRAIGKYKVVCGDSLSKIAHKFNISKNTLMRLNHLDDKATVKIGQIFNVPLSQKMIDAIANAKYTVESGDTLISIAKKFNLNPKDLVRFNHIKTTNIIKEGKKLTLPLPYIIKKLELEKKKVEAKKKKLEQEKLAKLKEKNKRVKMLRGFGKRKLRVTATAYTSHKNQTDKTPFIAAWNNHIRPGMKLIAVSRDLISRYGLRNGTKVKISGLPGYYRVKDKMNKRYKRRIDIYMGLNKRKALRWGRRSVVIYY